MASETFADELRAAVAGDKFTLYTELMLQAADLLDHKDEQINTRPAPAATDTGLVTAELRQEIFELAKDLFWRVDGNQRLWSGEEREVYGLQAAMQIARSQAEELLAAERAEKEKANARVEFLLKQISRAADERKALEADNAAQAAWINELELQLSASKETAKIKRVEYLDLDQDHSELKADYAVSEAQLKAVRKALEATHEAISEYYRYQTGGEMRGSYDGKPERNALWKSMYQARAVLGGKPS